MVRKAWDYAKKNNFQFIATGEVLGERPMSQNKQSLELVSKESGVGDYLLRPLSAKLLPETISEKKGWVDRNKLLAIKGRSRKPQLELAQKWEISEFPTPTGGCLLTDPGYSQRLKNMFQYWPNFDVKDASNYQIWQKFLVLW